MKKIKSRKGFTLVELVVTVAILSIVLGLGTGAFVMVMQNYGTASSYEQEQEKATQIENFIVRAARTAKSVKLIDKNEVDYKTYTIPSDEGTYIFSEGGSSIVQLYEYKVFDDTVGTTDPEKTPSINVSGVQRLQVSLKRQKMNDEAAKPDSKENFIYLDYTIEMVAGYTLRGSVVMNNLEDDGSRTQSSTNVDPIDSLVVCEYNEDSTSGTISDKAVLFIE